MADVIYGPIIAGMTWSYSRIKSFHDCPYRWYLHYLRGFPGEATFFASFGSLMHSLLDGFYKGEIPGDELPTEYLLRFRREVQGKPPSQKVWNSYFHGGLSYLRAFRPLPVRVLRSEQHLDFQVFGIPCQGVIDLMGEGEHGLVIVDHKSRALKKRSGRAKPTASDKELDDYLIQLYLYAEAVNQHYGEYPKELCFNCFRTGEFIREPFDPAAFERAKTWLAKSFHEILDSEQFPPDAEFFKCSYLCECKDDCPYYEMVRS